MFSPAALRDICRSLLVEDFDDDEIVFRAGDYGDKFYTVYHGEVHVLVDTHPSDELHRASSALASATTPTGVEDTPTPDQVEREMQTSSPSPLVSPSSSPPPTPAPDDSGTITDTINEVDANDGEVMLAMESSSGNDQAAATATTAATTTTTTTTPMSKLTQHQKDRLEDKKRAQLRILRKHENLDLEDDIVGCIGMVRVAIIQQLGSFGDLALLNDTPRSATIVTKAASTIFLTLSRSSYERCIRDFEKNLLATRFATLSNVPAFRHWPEEDLKAVCLLLTEQTVRAGEIVFKQDDVGTNLWIVRSGELRGIKKVKASELGVGLVGVDLHQGTDVERPKIHSGGVVFLNVGEYHVNSIFGELALIPRTSLERNSNTQSDGDDTHGKGAEGVEDESDDEQIGFHSAKFSSMTARDARGSDSMKSWHNKAYWEKHAKSHRQPMSVIATTACSLYVVSKQQFGRRVQQFSDSLRSGVDSMPTYHESLTSHAETTDWKCYKAACVLEVLQKKNRDRAEQQYGGGSTTTTSRHHEPLLDRLYAPSNGDGLRETRFLASKKDDWMNFLMARKARRDCIKRIKLSKKNVLMAPTAPKNNDKDGGEDLSDDEEKEKNLMTEEEEAELARLTVPMSPLRKRKLSRRRRPREGQSEEVERSKERMKDKVSSERTPTAPTKPLTMGGPTTTTTTTTTSRSGKGKGARQRRHVPTSSFWNLKRWISRPPMTLAHRRLLHPKDRKALDRDREKRFQEILGHQIYEGLSTFDNDKAMAVLLPHAAQPSDTMRSTLRLKSVKQMMSILGEVEEKEEMYCAGLDHFQDQEHQFSS